MDPKKGTPTPFPVGSYTGSCGKREAMDAVLKQQAEQQIKIPVIDPEEEQRSLDSLLQKE